MIASLQILVYLISLSITEGRLIVEVEALSTTSCSGAALLLNRIGTPTSVVIQTPEIGHVPLTEHVIDRVVSRHKSRELPMCASAL